MTASLPSRSLRSYGGGFLAGLISAGIFIYALTLQGAGFLMLDILAATPLYMAGLGVAASNTVYAVVTAVVALIVLKTVSLSLYYVAVFGLPAALLTYMALRQINTPNGKVWMPEGYLLTAITLYPCIAFLAGEALVSGHLLGITLDAMKTYTDQWMATDHPKNQASINGFLAVLNQLAHILPGIVGIGWIMVMLMSMFVSQSTMSQQNWNVRPNFDLTKIYISKWLVLGAIVAGLAGRFAPVPFDYLGANICMMLIPPFFFQGLSVVHVRADTSLFKVWILAAYYICLFFFLFQWLMVLTFSLTILLGVADLWFDFRPRFIAKLQQLKVRRTK